jgi:hypothetical protein
MQQRVHQRSPSTRVIPAGSASVHHHARRLIYHRNVSVFVNNLQWNFFCNRFQRFRFRLANY